MVSRHRKMRGGGDHIPVYLVNVALYPGVTVTIQEDDPTAVWLDGRVGDWPIHLRLSRYNLYTMMEMIQGVENENYTASSD